MAHYYICSLLLDFIPLWGASFIKFLFFWLENLHVFFNRFLGSRRDAESLVWGPLNKKSLKVDQSALKYSDLSPLLNVKTFIHSSHKLSPLIFPSMRGNLVFFSSSSFTTFWSSLAFFFFSSVISSKPNFFLKLNLFFNTTTLSQNYWCYQTLLASTVYGFYCCF